jgi:hypothetical protein
MSARRVKAFPAMRFWSGLFLGAALVTACGDGGGAGDPDGSVDPDGSGDDDADASVDPDADTTDAGPTVDPSAYVFDESQVRTYDITVAEEDWTWLNENALLEEFVPASVTVSGETFPNASIRYKGSYGTLNRCFDPETGHNNGICKKIPLKLAWDQVDPEGKFHGVKKINLHAMDADPTKMHDAIGYKLFRDAGVAAPRTAYANVKINGELIGLFAVVENVDGRFTRHNFPEDGEGNLYKEEWLDETRADEWLEALKTNEDEDPSVARILRFVDEMDEAGDEGFLDAIGSWTDVDQLVGYFAVARLIDSWDDLGTFYCYMPSGKCVNHNFYWYEHTQEDKVVLIPWDLDHTFEEPSPLRENYGMPDWDETGASCDWITMYAGVQGRAPACDPFLRRIVTQLWPEYVAQSQALLDGPFAAEEMDERIDDLIALIEPHYLLDPTYDEDDWEWSKNYIRDAVDAKRAYIADKMTQPAPQP